MSDAAALADGTGWDPATRPSEAQEAAQPAAVAHDAGHGMAQIALGLLVWAIYLALNSTMSGLPGGADGRGLAVLDAERWLHIDVEKTLNHWLAAQPPVLGWLAAWEYALTYIVTTFAVLAWIWWRRPARYVWARNTLLWTTVIAIGCFALWPTTPPRLLPGNGFVDIVSRHHPFLSWGGGTVSAGANQYAAMPSLHIGWAAWVTVVTLRVRASRTGYVLAALHLLVTAVVVVATGNHYLLDVAAGLVLVALALWVEAGRVHVVAVILPGERVASADEFFVHVEDGRVQQPVGGFVILDAQGAGAARGPLDLPALRALVAERIVRMPRFRQRLRPPGVWRHARWVPADPDLAVHVREHRLPDGGGRDALARFVAWLCEQQLDRARPLWQIWLVPDLEPGRAVAIGVMHHAVADGLGVVDILRQLFEPALPPPDLSGVRVPSRLTRAAAGVSGLAQLATDGTADRLPFTTALSGRREFRTALTPLEPVRALARRERATVTDVLLAATGEAVAAILREQGHVLDGRALRAAVPMTTRLPAPDGTGRVAMSGNRTSALRLDVPLGSMTPLQRLHRTRDLARRRRRSGRAIAAEAVMGLIGVLPPFLHRRLARSMYHGGFFTAIVSNMPGPTVAMRMGGLPIRDVYPMLPLAERVPLGVGTLGWNGQFCLSVITDPLAFTGAGDLAARIVAAIEAMLAGEPAAGPVLGASPGSPADAGIAAPRN